VFHAGARPIRLTVKPDSGEGVVRSLFSSPRGSAGKPEKYIGSFLMTPVFARGNRSGATGPWNSLVEAGPGGGPGKLEESDVQFFYCSMKTASTARPTASLRQRGTARPSEGNTIVSAPKLVSFSSVRGRRDVPVMSVGFGRTPYVLFESLWGAGNARDGAPENLRKKKTFSCDP